MPTVPNKVVIIPAKIAHPLGIFIFKKFNIFLINEKRIVTISKNPAEKRIFFSISFDKNSYSSSIACASHPNKTITITKKFSLLY